METDEAKACFIDMLQRAHAGELAAAYAYHGHANSVQDSQEKIEIKKIEAEEWHHRDRIREMLSELAAVPRPKLEFIFRLIGKTIAFLCHVGGWFIPMYGAGKFERGNIVEYEVAARLAHWAGLTSYVDELLIFAETEWEHEQYYRAKVLSHKLKIIFKVWPAPPLKEKIRESFNNFLKTNDLNQLASDVFTINRVGRYQKLALRTSLDPQKLD